MFRMIFRIAVTVVLEVLVAVAVAVGRAGEVLPAGFKQLFVAWLSSNTTFAGHVFTSSGFIPRLITACKTPSFRS
jgi:hypothetical protein